MELLIYIAAAINIWRKKSGMNIKKHYLILKKIEIVEMVLFYCVNLLFLHCINQIEKIMARPIGETPVLYGEDAVRFLKEMENVKSASNEEKDRVRKAYDMLKKIATFNM